MCLRPSLGGYPGGIHWSQPWGVRWKGLQHPCEGWAKPSVHSWATSLMSHCGGCSRCLGDLGTCFGGPGQLLGRFSGECLVELRGRVTKSSGSLSRSWGEHSLSTSWGECLGKSVKDPGTSRQVFGGILAAIPGSSRATDLGIRGQLMQSVWGDTGKIPGEPWGKCWLRSASGILVLGGSRYVPWGAHKMFCKVLGDSLQVPWGFLGECD